MFAEKQKEAPGQEPRAASTQQTAASKDFDTLIKGFEGSIYRDDRSGITIFLKNSTHNGVYLRDRVFVRLPGSKEAHQLYELGSSGSSGSDYGELFQASLRTVNGTIRLDLREGRVALSNERGVAVTLREVTNSLDKARIEATTTFTELPQIFKAEYAGILPDRRSFCISAPEVNRRNAGYRLHVGTPGDMREVAIAEFKRYRDGGTTYVKTEIGTFFFPSPAKQDAGAPSFTPSGSAEALPIALVARGQLGAEMVRLGIPRGSGREASVALPAAMASFDVSRLVAHPVVPQEARNALVAAAAGLANATPVSSPSELSGQRYTFQDPRLVNTADGHTFFRDRTGAVFFRTSDDPQDEWTNYATGQKITTK